MRIAHCVLLAAGLAVAASSTASAQSLSTFFIGTNGGSAGGGTYFQIVVGPNPINITGFDVNSTTVGNLGFRAFTTPGTNVGNETNAGIWTQVTSGTVNGLGTDQMSPATLNNSFALAANTSYGIAITLSDPTNTAVVNGAQRYTNGTGTNQMFSNADLTLNLGTASNVLFTAGIFSPRVWNGTVYYTVVPAPASLALLGLGGLVATRRRRA